MLEKKGLVPEVLARFMNLYSEGITIPMVNNILGSKLSNRRLSLRQSDRPSGIWFCHGIDPLLPYLETRLAGIAEEGQQSLLQPQELGYKVQGYLHDCKQAITSMSEVSLVDKASNLFERASGCRLHRDPSSNKCKMLALGRWKGVLQQEDIP